MLRRNLKRDSVLHLSIRTDDICLEGREEGKEAREEVNGGDGGQACQVAMSKDLFPDLFPSDRSEERFIGRFSEADREADSFNLPFDVTQSAVGSPHKRGRLSFTLYRITKLLQRRFKVCFPTSFYLYSSSFFYVSIFIHTVRPLPSS